MINLEMSREYLGVIYLDNYSLIIISESGITELKILIDYNTVYIILARDSINNT